MEKLDEGSSSTQAEAIKEGDIVMIEGELEFAGTYQMIDGELVRIQEAKESE